MAYAARSTAAHSTSSVEHAPDPIRDTLARAAYDGLLSREDCLRAQRLIEAYDRAPAPLRRAELCPIAGMIRVLNLPIRLHPAA